jgi:hypothetical protein
MRSPEPHDTLGPPTPSTVVSAQKVQSTRSRVQSPGHGEKNVGIVAGRCRDAIDVEAGMC